MGLRCTIHCTSHYQYPITFPCPGTLQMFLTENSFLIHRSSLNFYKRSVLADSVYVFVRVRYVRMLCINRVQVELLVPRSILVVRNSSAAWERCNCPSNRKTYGSRLQQFVYKRCDTTVYLKKFMFLKCP